MIKNPLRSTRIEFHILQSFPVSCLNRDDVGAPKTATIGGVTRARVTSQCWKRQVRLAMHDLGVVHGQRTKLISKLVADACIERGATPEQGKACGDKIEGAFIKKKEETDKAREKREAKEAKKALDGGDADVVDADDESGAEKSDTLLFLSPSEVNTLADYFLAKDFKPNEVITKTEQKKQAKEIADLISKSNQAIDAVDIALFGRMVAQAAEMSVEGAASFSHAISTHKVSNEVDFFTALDDLSTDPGAAHMGSIEFNSATYYRYISLDLGQLHETLAGVVLPEAVEAFTKALFTSVPAARQATQSGASPWEFAKVFVRKGHRLQVPFETAIKPAIARDGGFIQPSIEALTGYLSIKEKQAGALFGKLSEFTISDESETSIDDLIAGLRKHAEGAAHE